MIDRLVRFILHPTQAARKFNASDDAIELRAAMKGLGTRKAPIVKVLTGKTIGQRIKIRQAYEASAPTRQPN